MRGAEKYVTGPKVTRFTGLTAFDMVPTEAHQCVYVNAHNSDKGCNPPVLLPFGMLM